MVPGGFGCLLYDSSHQFHRVHVACLGGTHIDGTAYALGLVQRLGKWRESGSCPLQSCPLLTKGGIARR